MDNIDGDEDLIGKIIMFLLSIDYSKTEKLLKDNPAYSYK